MTKEQIMQTIEEFNKNIETLTMIHEVVDLDGNETPNYELLYKGVISEINDMNTKLQGGVIDIDKSSLYHYVGSGIKPFHVNMNLPDFPEINFSSIEDPLLISNDKCIELLGGDILTLPDTKNTPIILDPIIGKFKPYSILPAEYPRVYTEYTPDKKFQKLLEFYLFMDNTWNYDRRYTNASYKFDDIETKILENKIDVLMSKVERYCHIITDEYPQYKLGDEDLQTVLMSLENEYDNGRLDFITTELKDELTIFTKFIALKYLEEDNDEYYQALYTDMKLNYQETISFKFLGMLEVKTMMKIAAFEGKMSRLNLILNHQDIENKIIKSTILETYEQYLELKEKCNDK